MEGVSVEGVSVESQYWFDGMSDFQRNLQFHVMLYAQNEDNMRFN